MVEKLSQKNQGVRRLRAELTGAVQGVGFRPFVYRLATNLGLSGSIGNSMEGVIIEAEGEGKKLDEFLARIDTERPVHSHIEGKTVWFIQSTGQSGFRIAASAISGEKTALVLPDIATCSECKKDISDPGNRRFRYPFTNCTCCGPRYSIVESLPYDRANTTMRGFVMCDECRTEYENPLDRRFHAQPNACSVCGPHLELWDFSGKVLAKLDDSLQKACEAVRRGDILALKGLGGFQLIVDARNRDAIRRLRIRKARAEKPFALMYPGIESVDRSCTVSDMERQLLCSSESPIVILHKRIEGSEVDPAVAPGNPCLGVMLPYTPLHHLLMADLNFPVLATSGNMRDEPICIDEYEALSRLRGIADLFLVHNRPIARHVDDSIVRVIMDRASILRRARGYVPLPVTLKEPSTPCLALGGHQKNTVAVARGRHVFVSQHLGDLDTRRAYETASRVAGSMLDLYGINPTLVCCDKHSDYMSTRLAQDYELPQVRVQHHHAHVLSCVADNELEGTVLGVAWDGSGFGGDATVWGGEFLKVKDNEWLRVAHMRTFSLPGNERAILEPKRSALGVLYEIYGDKLFSMDLTWPLSEFTRAEKGILRKVLEKRINSPVTSSAGRLFDAVASITGLSQVTTFQGQAAMTLEFAAGAYMNSSGSYDFGFQRSGRAVVIDWEPMIRNALDDVRKAETAGQIAAKFHHTLADIIVHIAREIGEEAVVLTGGCFQNRLLTECAIRRLKAAGFKPYWHRSIPPNDGGLALGQILGGIHNRQEE